MSIVNTLTYIARELNNYTIDWAIGGSVLLYFHEIIDVPNDIDIIVSEKDFNQLNKHMKKLGLEKNTIHIEPFRTKSFSKYEIQKIGIDIMSGFAIKHDTGVYEMIFNINSIVSNEKLNGARIPLCSLEDWYILYQLIPNREEKTALIEKSLKENGVQHPKLLHQALKQVLPQEVRCRAKDLLENGEDFIVNIER